MTKRPLKLEYPPLRFSGLKLMDKSAAHYRAGRIEDKSPMRKGTALHSFLIGDKDRVCVFEEGARNDRHAKYQEFKAANLGKEILIPSEMIDVQGMRRAVEAHPRAMELLEGEREKRIEWTIGDRKCSGTPDVVRCFGDRKRLVELKSSFTTAIEPFKWHARKMAYHAQVDWYSNGIDSSMTYPSGLPTEEHFIVAVEATAPYPVTVFELDEKILLAGRKRWRQWFEALRICEATHHFPAYAQADVLWTDDQEEGDGLEWSDDDEAA